MLAKWLWWTFSDVLDRAWLPRFSQLCSNFSRHQFILNIYAPYNTLCWWTEMKVGWKSFTCAFSLFYRDFQVILYSNLGDLEQAIHIFNITFHFRLIPVFPREDLLRGQHRGQCISFRQLWRQRYDRGWLRVVCRAPPCKTFLFPRGCHNRLAHWIPRSLPFSWDPSPLR